MRLNCWKCVIVAILAFWFIAPLAHAQAPQMLVKEGGAGKYITLWDNWRHMDPALKKTEHWEKRGSTLGVWCANAALLNMPCTREYWKRNIKPGTKFYLPLTPGALEYMVAARKEGKIAMLTPVEGKPGVYALSDQTPSALAQETGTLTTPVASQKITGESGYLLYVAVFALTLVSVMLFFTAMSVLAPITKTKTKSASELEERAAMSETVLRQMKKVTKVKYRLPDFAKFMNGTSTTELAVVSVTSDGEFVVEATFTPKIMRLSKLDIFLHDEWRAGRSPYNISWTIRPPENIQPPDEPPKSDISFVPPMPKRAKDQDPQ